MLIPNHPHDERLSALASGDPEAVADSALSEHVASCHSLHRYRRRARRAPRLARRAAGPAAASAVAAAPAGADVALARRPRRWLGAPLLRPGPHRRRRPRDRRPRGHDGPLLGGMAPPARRRCRRGAPMQRRRSRRRRGAPPPARDRRAAEPQRTGGRQPPRRRRASPQRARRRPRTPIEDAERSQSRRAPIWPMSSSPASRS